MALRDGGANVQGAYQHGTLGAEEVYLEIGASFFAKIYLRAPTYTVLPILLC